eukprot:gene8409-18302_t
MCPSLLSISHLLLLVLLFAHLASSDADKKRNKVEERPACVWDRPLNLRLPMEQLREKGLHGNGSVCPPKELIGKEDLGHEGTVIRAPYFNMTHSKPFFFCWIAKNSCTKLKALFSRLGGREGFRVGNSFHRVHMQFFGESSLMYKNKSDEEVDSYFRSPNVQKAIIIRDPIDRFVSGFLDKVTTKVMPDFLKKEDIDIPTTTAASVMAYLEMTASNIV